MKRVFLVLGFLLCFAVLQAQDCGDEDRCEQPPPALNPLTGLAGGLAGIVLAALIALRLRRTGHHDGSGWDDVPQTPKETATDSPKTEPPSAEMPATSALAETGSVSTLVRPAQSAGDTVAVQSENTVDSKVSHAHDAGILTQMQDRWSRIRQAIAPILPNTKRLVASLWNGREQSLAILLYVVLVDVAVEAFLDASPVRWVAGSLVAAYLILAILFLRKLSWAMQSSASVCVLLGLLALGAWSKGLAVARLPGTVLLEIVITAAIVASGVLLTQLRFLPRAVKWGIAVLTTYAALAVLWAILTESNHGQLFSASFWTGRFFWLRGAFLGAFVLLPAAVFFQLATGIWKGFASEKPGWRFRSIALSMAFIVAVSQLQLSAPSQMTAGRRNGSTSSSSSPGLRPVDFKIEQENTNPQFSRLQEIRSQINRAEFDLSVRASSLGANVEKIFAFVRDEICYQAYPGVLRGAKGALLGKAGNALDKSLLLAELLKANGIAVRFASGSLDGGKVQLLLNQMVRPQQPAETSPASNLPAANTAAPPGSEDILGEFADVKQEVDGLLASVHDDRQFIRDTLQSKHISFAKDLQTEARSVLKEIRQHFWVQFQRDGRWIDLDPSFSTAGVGDHYASLTSTYSELPPELFQTTTFRVKIEQLRGSDLQVKTVLESHYLTAELTAASISFTNVPIGSEANDPLERLEKAAKFLPTLRINGQEVHPNAFDLNGNVLPATEVTSGNPVGGAVGGAFGAITGALNQATDGGQPAGGSLTAEWVEIASTAPGEPERIYEREVLDRIGVENRTDSGEEDIQPEYTDEKRVRYILGTEQRIWVETAPVSPGFVRDRVISQWISKNALIQAVRQTEESSGDNANAAAQYAQAAADDLSPELLAFSTSAKGLGDRLVKTDYAHAVFYHAIPEIVIFKTKLDLEPGGTFWATRGYDIVENRVRTVSPDGTVGLGDLALSLGVMETHLERSLASHFNDLLSAVLSDQRDANPQFESVDRPESVVDVFAAGRAAGIPNVIIPATPPPEMDISPAAVERLRSDIARGYVAVTPKMVPNPDEGDSTGWWRIDPATGTALGMMESGEGQAATEYSGLTRENVRRVLCSALTFIGRTACALLTIIGYLSIALLAYQIASGQVELDLQTAADFAVGMAMGQVVGAACRRIAKGGFCFVAGTPVQVVKDQAFSAGTASYPRLIEPDQIETKAIEEIEPGDLVVSRRIGMPEIHAEPVLKTFQRVSPEVITLTLAEPSTGRVLEKITTTPDHPFYTSTKGFVEAGQLGIGTAIVTRAGPDLEVVDWERRSSPEGFQVFNLKVKDEHTYFVGRVGALVHNANYKGKNGKNGAIPKPPKGKGSVPKSQRDPKRVWTKAENQRKLARQNGKCGQCDQPVKPGEERGHHIKRHACGGKTNDKNHVVVCNPCHKGLHH